MKGIHRSRILPLLLLLATLASTGDAHATVFIHLSPAAATVGLGETVDLELRADLSADDVIGFGLDLVLDSSFLVLEDVSIAAPWQPVFAPDGDGLAAFAPLAGAPSVADVLLATVTLRALALGETQLSVAATPSDLTEGFPLASPPGAFADLDSGTATIEIQEPPTALYLALLGALAAARRPRR